MKSRAFIPLLIGLAIGLVAIKLFADVLKKARGATGGETVKVVTANSDIPPAVEIKESMLELRSVPKSLLPKDAFQEIKPLVGRVTCEKIPQGIFILQNLLAKEGTPAGMAVRIREGYRAVTVKVDEFAGVAGWIKSGCHVDVVTTMNTVGESGRTEVISKVILESVEVLGVGQDMNNSASSSNSNNANKSVTLLIKSDDVPKLHLATTKGQIRLAMRNQLDSASSKPAETTDNELFGNPSEQKSNAEPQKKSFLSYLFSKEPKINSDETDKKVEVSRASNKTEVQVDAPPPAKVWRVEVMAGSKVEEVLFDGDAKDARRLNKGAGNISSGSRQNDREQGWSKSSGSKE